MNKCLKTMKKKKTLFKKFLSHFVTHDYRLIVLRRKTFTIDKPSNYFPLFTIREILSTYSWFHFPAPFRFLHIPRYSESTLLNKPYILSRDAFSWLKRPFGAFFFVGKSFVFFCNYINSMSLSLMHPRSRMRTLHLHFFSKSCRNNLLLRFLTWNVF